MRLSSIFHAYLSYHFYTVIPLEASPYCYIIASSGSQKSGTEFVVPLAPREVSVARLSHRYYLSKHAVTSFPRSMSIFSMHRRPWGHHVLYI